MVYYDGASSSIKSAGNTNYMIGTTTGISNQKLQSLLARKMQLRLFLHQQ